MWIFYPFKDCNLSQSRHEYMLPPLFLLSPPLECSSISAWYQNGVKGQVHRSSASVVILIAAAPALSSDVDRFIFTRNAALRFSHGMQLGRHRGVPSRLEARSGQLRASAVDTGRPPERSFLAQHGNRQSQHRGSDNIWSGTLVMTVVGYELFLNGKQRWHRTDDWQNPIDKSILLTCTLSWWINNQYGGWSLAMMTEKTRKYLVGESALIIASHRVSHMKGRMTNVYAIHKKQEKKYP